MFKIHINDGLTEMPTDNIFYIISKEGIFLKKKMGLVDSITPVNKLSFLKEMNEKSRATLNIPKIPKNIVASIWKFFNEVYKLYYGEAIIMIYYNEKEKKYKFNVPKQEVSGGALDYKTNICDGYNLIGDIHSHGSMSAFHSGTDSHDEKNFDGLHITFGNVNQENFSISSSIVVNGFRNIVDNDMYLEGIKEYTPATKQVKSKSTLLNKLVNNSMTHDIYMLTVDIDKIFYDEKWMDNVDKRKYVPPNNMPFVKNQNQINKFGFGKIRDIKLNNYWNQPQNNFVNENENPCESCIFRDNKVDLLMGGMEDYDKYLLNNEIENEDLETENEYLDRSWKHAVDYIDKNEKDDHEK